MAELLTRHGIVYHLHKIIEEAEQLLVIISPYIRMDDMTKSLLQNKTSDIDIRVIYRDDEKELNPNLISEDEAFLQQQGISVSFIENLHTKCYLNESEALVTSMNLLESSIEHNEEMGILVSRQGDTKLYQDIYQQAKRLNDISQFYLRGFCIRCGSDIIADPEKPYCYDCYLEWDGDENEEEEHCHICGKEYAATKRKPACYSCYTKY